MWDKKWVWILIGVLLTLILKGCFDSEIYWPNADEQATLMNHDGQPDADRKIES